MRKKSSIYLRFLAIQQFIGNMISNINNMKAWYGPIAIFFILYKHALAGTDEYQKFKIKAKRVHSSTETKKHCSHADFYQKDLLSKVPSSIEKLRKYTYITFSGNLQLHSAL